MDRSEINNELQQHHQAFIARVSGLPMHTRAASRNGKWTPAQHLEHILRGVRPVALAVRLPRWLLRWWFGKPNRPPRDYDAIVARYTEKLAAGGRAFGVFVPPAVPATKVERIAGSLRKTVHSLTRCVDGWSEHDLDTVLLPHPLLGKLTVREMLYFTIYHVRHHQALVERDTA